MRKKQILPPAHYLDKQIAQTVHPVLVNLIGVGGTGSHVLLALADINQTLLNLGGPGLVVRAFDAKKVASHNLGRQRFSEAEIGMEKADALINRINRCTGTYWRAMIHAFSEDYELSLQKYLSAQITISCVDTVKARFEIERILLRYVANEQDNVRESPSYWLDFGNGRDFGQVFLSTLQSIEQPSSKEYNPVPTLPIFTQEYRQWLESIDDRDGPSCSTAEALSRQDMFVNPILANCGCRLLWRLLIEGKTTTRGIFVNAGEYKMVPVPVSLPPKKTALKKAA